MSALKHGLSGLRARLASASLLQLTLMMIGVVVVTLVLATAPIRLGDMFSSSDAEAASPGNLHGQLGDELPDELLELASLENVDEKLEGDAAELTNASLPFSTAPLETARPFYLGGGSMSDAQRAQRCMAQAVYYEAAFEPIAGRRAVAQVVLNRVRHPAYPNSVCGVVYQGVTRPVCQFSFTCDGSLRRTPGVAAWSAAATVAREALAGNVASSVGMATHYHADYVSPYWAPRLTKLRQIGRHIFYRFPGNWGRRGAFVGRYAGREAIPQRVVIRDESGEIDDEAMAIAGATLPPDPTDRHAPEDVGGRLDTSTGWTLSIPDPDEATGGLQAVMGNQQADSTLERSEEPASGASDD